MRTFGIERAQAEEWQGSNQESAYRDGLIQEISGLFWAQLLVDMGLFKSYPTSAKALRRLHRELLIRRVGFFDVTPNQKRAQVFTNSVETIKRDTIATHEIPLSRLLSKYYRLADAIRGPYGVDQQNLHDREMDVGSVTYGWEYFTGKQSLPQLTKRFKKLIGKQPILAVTRKPKYIEVLKKASKPVHDRIYFALYEEVLKSPLGKVWETIDGENGETVDSEKVGIVFPVPDAVPDPSQSSDD